MKLLILGGTVKLGSVPNAIRFVHNSAPLRALAMLAHSKASCENGVVFSTPFTGGHGWLVIFARR